MIIYFGASESLQTNNFNQMITCYDRADDFAACRKNLDRQLAMEQDRIIHFSRSFFIIINQFVTWFVILYMSRRLLRPGINQVNLKNFFESAASFIIVLNSLWIVFLLHDMQNIFHAPEAVFRIMGQYDMIQPSQISSTAYDEQGVAITQLFNVYLELSTLLLVIVFLGDLYTRQLMYRHFMSYFGVVVSSAQKKELDQTLLKSNLSVELLYVILQSITKFSKENKKLMLLNQSFKESIHSEESHQSGKKSETMTPADLEIQQDDFGMIRQIQLQNITIPKGDDTIVINRQVTVKEFSAGVFEKLRMLDSINNDQIIESLSMTNNLKQILKSGESTGKSGSFMFMSHCGKFIIKTMFNSEFHIIMDGLETYTEYIIKNPSSLISRFYGCFEIQMEGLDPIKLILMQNTIQKYEEDSKIIKVYDLKGSMVHREVVLGENQTMKDINLLNCKKSRIKRGVQGLIQFRPNEIPDLVQTIDADSMFLQSLSLLDYSLLLAVEQVKKESRPGINNSLNNNSFSRPSKSHTFTSWQKSDTSSLSSRNQFKSSCGNYIYHVSVIDFLTMFNFEKKMESFYKVYVKNQNAKLISCVEPKLYGSRFRNFMKNEVILNEDANQSLKFDTLMTTAGNDHTLDSDHFQKKTQFLEARLKFQ